MRNLRLTLAAMMGFALGAAPGAAGVLTHGRGFRDRAPSTPRMAEADRQRLQAAEAKRERRALKRRVAA